MASPAKHFLQGRCTSVSCSHMSDRLRIISSLLFSCVKSHIHLPALKSTDTEESWSCSPGRGPFSAGLGGWQGDCSQFPSPPARLGTALCCTQLPSLYPTTRLCPALCDHLYPLTSITSGFLFQVSCEMFLRGIFIPQSYCFVSSFRNQTEMSTVIFSWSFSLHLH